MNNFLRNKLVSCQLHFLAVLTHGLDDDRKSIDCHQEEEVNMLHNMESHELLIGVQPNVGISCDVGVSLQVVGMDVVLHHMLMNPRN